MYPGHVFVSQCKAASIKPGSRFNFWISQPFPPNPEELVHFRAVSYSVPLNLSASRLGKKYKLCETAILQPFASLIFKTKIMGYFFGWQVCPLLQRWTGLLILCSHAGLKPVAWLAAEARGFLQVGRLALVLQSRCVQAREDGEKMGQWGVMNLLHLHQCSAPCAWRIKPEYYSAVQFGGSSIWRYLSGMSGTFSSLPFQLLWEWFFTLLAAVS